MRGIERRVVSLEDRRRIRDGSFGHLDDDALDRAAIGLVEQIEHAGVTMPGDWRERYREAPSDFMAWVAEQAGEMVECAD